MCRHQQLCAGHRRKYSECTLSVAPALSKVTVTEVGGTQSVSSYTYAAGYMLELRQERWAEGPVCQQAGPLLLRSGSGFVQAAEGTEAWKLGSTGCIGAQLGENVGSVGGGGLPCSHHSAGRAEEMLFTSQ